MSGGTFSDIVAHPYIYIYKYIYIYIYVCMYVCVCVLLYNRVFICFKQHVYYVSINSFIYYVSKSNFLEQHVYNNMMFTSLILD